MQKFEKIRKIIHSEFPDFFISSIKKIGEGDNSKAFLIDKNYIFRFPKREEVKQDIKKEIAVLPKIKSFLTLAIPDFKFISKEISFVGYKSIHGEFLTPDIYSSLGSKNQIKIQKSLALFLNQLHESDLQILKNCDLETMNYKEEYSDNFENVQTLIYPNLNLKEREIITKVFISYFNTSENFKYKQALIHNDFSTDHILFEKSNNEISGIIDFGDLAIGDPDYDLMYLFGSFGENFISKLLQFYRHNNPENLLKKLIFFNLATKLQILINATRDNDQYDIKDGYKKLKKWIKNKGR
ncbi:MAG: aminoglycoside phosphotransferase family protein [Bacteroidota bacterium]|nr:aminoglycoside phosphotransferase family protein [Bacteroidota bacterium]